MDQEEASEEERNRIFDAWEVGVEAHNPLVAVDDMELGQGGTVIAMYPDDGECDEENEREYMKYVDEMVSSIRSNPPV